MNIIFRQATLSDFNGAWTALDNARNMMISIGRKQWSASYPSQEILLCDIREGHGYVLVSGEEVLAYAAVALNGEPLYDDLDGHWLSESDYMVVHRLAVNTSHRGEGLSKRYFAEVENWAKSIGVNSIKVDTNHDNVEMLNMLPKIGYVYCGEVDYGVKGKRMAYEKLL